MLSPLAGMCRPPPLRSFAFTGLIDCEIPEHVAGRNDLTRAGGTKDLSALSLSFISWVGGGYTRDLGVQQSRRFVGIIDGHREHLAIPQVEADAGTRT